MCILKDNGCSRKGAKDACRRGCHAKHSERTSRVQLEVYNSSFDLVQRVLGMEDKPGQGTIDSNLVEEHEFRSCSKSCQPGVWVL